MKIIHTADLHIDSPLTTHLSADKVRERRAELFSVLSSLVEEARRQGARIIIIAGDLFDSDRITKTARKRTLALIAASRDISFFYLPGNHEAEALFSSEDMLPENLFVFGSEWTYFSSGELIIAGRSTTSADMFDTLALDKSRRGIAVLHGELCDRSGTDGKIGRRDAVGRGIDYLALGHYHSYHSERIDDRCTAVYPGTPEGRGFDETGDKGYVLIECDGIGVAHSFVPFARRRLHEIYADVSGASNLYTIEEAAERALAGIGSRDLVRLILTGYHPVGITPDITALTARFATGYYYFEVKDETGLRINAADYEHDLSLKGEFIRLVMSDPELSEKKKEEIISCGLSALFGEVTL